MHVERSCPELCGKLEQNEESGSRCWDRRQKGGLPELSLTRPALVVEEWSWRSIGFCGAEFNNVAEICWPTLMHQVGIPVYSEHAIAAYFAYFAKMRISHVFPHIMAFSGFQYSLQVLFSILCK